MISIRSHLLLCKLIILAPLFAVSMTAFSEGVSAKTDRDDQVRAAIIFNLTRFTRWPSEAFESPSSPLKICVSEKLSIATGLKTMQGKLLHGRTLEVVLVEHSPSEFKNCQVVVLSPENARLAISNFKIHTLYVSTEEGLAPSISAIELVTVGRQTRFNVKPVIAKNSGIEISSKLINLAVKVQ